MAGALHDQFLGEALPAQVGFGHVLGVAAQHDVGAAAGHICGDGDRALFARLRYDLGFLFVVLGVQNLVLHAAAAQQLAQQLALFNGNGAHQHGLALFMALDDLLDNGVELGRFGFVHHVVVVGAGHGLVRGHLHHLQAVDLLKLGGLRLCGARHAGELFVHAEIVLERDGGQRAALAGDGDALLGLDGLVQPLIVAAAQHQAAGELVHDDDLAVAHHIIHVPLHHAPRLDGLVDVMLQRHVRSVGQIFNIEVLFSLGNAAGGKRGRLFFLVHNIIAVHLLVLVLFVVQLGHDGGLQALGKIIGQLVQIGAFIALAAEDGVRLVHDGVIMPALHHLLFVGDHVVAQVIEAEFIVGAVGNVGIVGGAAFLACDAVDDEPHRKTQKFIQLSHPLAVAFGQVIVHGDDVHALAGERVQIYGQRGDKRFALAGFHLGDAGAVQHDAAHHLYGKVFHAQHAPACLAAYGKGVGQNVVQRFAPCQTLPERGRHRLQLAVGHGLVPGLQRQHPVRDGLYLLELLRGKGAEQFFKKRQIFHSPSARRAAAQFHFIILLYRIRCQTKPSNFVQTNGEAAKTVRIRAFGHKKAPADAGAPKGETVHFSPNILKRNSLRWSSGSEHSSFASAMLPPSISLVKPMSWHSLLFRFRRSPSGVTINTSPLQAARTSLNSFRSISCISTDAMTAYLLSQFYFPQLPFDRPTFPCQPQYSM